ncbi:AMP-binding protein [Amycolatopsis sp. RM579]|uniref:AMP-binding protein n=2 Tax=Amycolatopsis pithecellobii TaxID=664692 RepID=A0A6N7Z240_9PSEU|nr:AMP-binding protein [Amycolatopsis pithecellobii]
MPAAPARPAFLTQYAPTRFRRAITPFSRVPVTARMGESWHVAAERAGSRRVLVDRPADIDLDGPTDRSYAEWAAMVDQAAGWLREAGVRPWDRVAILKANHLDVALLGCAAARLGAIPAMLAWTHSPEVARALLSRLEKPFLVTDRTQLTACRLDAATCATLTARTISIDASEGRPDVVALDDLRGAAAAPVQLRAAEEPMVITHTSGTTGIPKLVMHSAQTIHSLALVEAERWPLLALRAADTMAYCDPFCHQRMATALAAMATATPRMLMLSQPQSPRLKQLLLDNPPTVVETLPNIYLAWEGLARDDTRPFHNVRVYINSFDAIHTRTIRTFLDATDRRLPIWVQSWSQSEAGAIVIRPYLRSSVRRRGHRPAPTQLLGWPVPFLSRIRAVDPDTGAKVPRGHLGLIEIAQPGRSLAYVGEQERHDLKRDGWWWNTGDLGVINRFGAVRLVDREIDRIPGASALELEDVLLDRLPRTTEVVILAVDGMPPVPVISTANNDPLEDAEWATAVADLPPLAKPVHLSWADFPRTATWKIRRIALREQLFSGTSAIGAGRWT